jgi:2-polyprenyl-6-methoxyphenol hydroxylase-like FAD-dependent oxidoreductase
MNTTDTFRGAYLRDIDGTVHHKTGPVTVVGGAITGPAAALKLAQAGHDVTVYERRAEGELFSAGILGITHGVWRTLESHGVDMAPLTNGFEDFNAGSFTLSPFRYIAWTDLHRALVHAAQDAGARFQWETSVDAWTMPGEVVEATGVAGAARRMLAHRYSGFTIYRGLSSIQIPDPFVAFQMNPSGYFTMGYTPYGAFWAMFAPRPEPAQLTTSESRTLPPEIAGLPYQLRRVCEATESIAISPMSDWRVPEVMINPGHDGTRVTAGDVNGAVRPVTTSGANLAVLEGFATADLMAGGSKAGRESAKLLARRQYDLDLGAQLMGPEIGGSEQDGMFAEHHHALFMGSES